MKTILSMLFVLALAGTAVAQTPTADDYRGGWRTESGAPHVYEFSIRDGRVRGVYCTRCADATTLAFVDGTFGPRGLDFTVTYVRPDGSTTYQDKVTATFSGGRLLLTGTSGAPGGGRFERTLVKDSRGPDPLMTVPVQRLPPGPPVMPAPRKGGGAEMFQATPGTPWEAPGPWRQLTVNDVAGVWLGFRVGLNKQYFIFKRYGNGLRGMACGRCDNPYTMALIDDVQIAGDTVRFTTFHEDWGPGALPFRNNFTAHITHNEMRFANHQDNQPEPAELRFGSSLVGPIAIEATAGNE